MSRVSMTVTVSVSTEKFGGGRSGDDLNFVTSVEGKLLGER